MTYPVLIFIGLIFIAFGFLYLIKPNIYRRGLWKKTSIAQRYFSPEQYNMYMRILGIILLVAGLVCVIVGLL